VSEVKPQSKLNDARAMAGIGDQTECAAICRDIVTKASIRVALSRAVENVEHVGAELECHSLGKVRVLHNPKILAAVAWSTRMGKETR